MADGLQNNIIKPKKMNLFKRFKFGPIRSVLPEQKTMENASIKSVDARKNRILILGNGFDLDLGFKTSYGAFCEKFFKNNVIYEQYCKSGLFQFLKAEFNLTVQQHYRM